MGLKGPRHIGTQKGTGALKVPATQPEGLLLLYLVIIGSKVYRLIETKLN